MTAFMNMPDPATSSNTQGSHNADKKAPKASTEPNPKKTGKPFDKTGYSAVTEWGSGKGSYPSAGGGLAKTTLPGAEDNTLIKNYGK